MLDSKIATLIQTSPSLLYNLECNLLALQALILYQLIRLFDGDPRQRSNGERHLELLDSWTLRLQQNLTDAFDMTAVGGGGYRQWVLEESVRRTTMMSVVLRSLYGFMKFGVCELVPLLATLPVSKNSKLWKSPERIVRGNGKENRLVSYWDFTQEWNMGKVGFGEVEDYEKLLLVTCRHAFGTDDFRPA
jgi:hypothetical protein